MGGLPGGKGCLEEGRVEPWVGRESGKDENKQGEHTAGPPPGPGEAVGEVADRFPWGRRASGPVLGTSEQ